MPNNIVNNVDLDKVAQTSENGEKTNRHLSDQ